LRQERKVTRGGKGNGIGTAWVANKLPGKTDIWDGGPPGWPLMAAGVSF